MRPCVNRHCWCCRSTRQRSGSHVDLCIHAPEIGSVEQLELGAQLDDLLLPWRIDLQLDHLITHEGLREHIQRAGLALWNRVPLPSQR